MIDLADRSTLTPDQCVLADLVATPSFSGYERPAADVFVHHARRLGLDAEIDEVGNALAHRGPADAAVHIVCLGHIDTVPGDIPVRVEDGRLHGRGSADAKGPLAAMLCAAPDAELPPGVRLTVAGAVGEETPHSPGANFLARQLSPQACIIGEPSGWDGVTLGYKGRLLATGRASIPNHHSASGLPSPADLLTEWWADVRRLADAHNEGREGVFDQIQATLQRVASDCDGLTDTAEFFAGFRLPLDITPHELADRITALASGPVTVECSIGEVAYATDRNDPVVRALSGAIRDHGARPRPKRKTGTADLNVVGPIWRCPIAAYGPGDSSLDHTPEEHVVLEEFDRAVEVLEGAIGALAIELAEAHEAADRMQTT